MHWAFDFRYAESGMLITLFKRDSCLILKRPPSLVAFDGRLQTKFSQIASPLRVTMQAFDWRKYLDVTQHRPPLIGSYLFVTWICN
jgi:hypothetical protein